MYLMRKETPAVSMTHRLYRCVSNNKFSMFYFNTALKITFLPIKSSEEYVRLCTSLPVRILWRFAKTMHLRTGFGDQISKANLGSAAR